MEEGGETANGGVVGRGEGLGETPGGVVEIGVVGVFGVVGGEMDGSDGGGVIEMGADSSVGGGVEGLTTMY